MRHDVFPNPAPRTRAAFPFLVLLQADLASDGAFRIVAPLALNAGMPHAAGKLLPAVSHKGQAYRVVLDLMTSVPNTAVRPIVGSLAAYRDDIVRALDWLFTGV